MNQNLSFPFEVIFLSIFHKKDIIDETIIKFEEVVKEV